MLATALRGLCSQCCAQGATVVSVPFELTQHPLFGTSSQRVVKIVDHAGFEALMKTLNVKSWRIPEYRWKRSDATRLVDTSNTLAPAIPTQASAKLTPAFCYDAGDGVRTDSPHQYLLQTHSLSAQTDCPFRHGQTSRMTALQSQTSFC